MKKNLILGIIVLIIVVGVVFVGYFKNRQKQEKKNIFQEGGQIAPSPIPVAPTPSERLELSPITGTQPTPTYQPTSSYPLLFKDEYLYIDLFYPLLYVYDPDAEVVKYFDLENQAYKEIFRATLIEEAVISPDESGLVLKTKEGFIFLNLKNDSLYKLSPFTKNFIFTPQGLVLYINNKDISYLAFYKDGQMIKIRNLGVLNPKFESLKNFLLIYEKNSPVFSLNLKNPNDFSVFLEAKPDYSLLTNKDKNLIFVSYKNGYWQSQIINSDRKVQINFAWGTVKEKCSFDEFLVCAVPADLENFSADLWLLKQPAYDEKIIIYNPKNGEIKEIKLESKFDIIKPKLTPLGIIFWNRLDAKFYLIESEKLSL